MNSLLPPLEMLNPSRFDTPAILKKLASSSRRLAELKGVAASIPNQGILINTLGLQEAKDSSEIENIVTTHDELFKDDADPDAFTNPAAKEVLRYRQALRVGFEQVRASGLLTANHIIEIQAELERNHAGFRKLPGTALKDGAGRTVYTPPQDPVEIVEGVTSGNGSQRTLSLRGCRNPAVQSWHGHAQVLGHVARRHAAGQQLPG
ncbi:MAG: Fic/DOC family N-terminal domain-containing protein [Rhodoferax sp.]